MKTLKKLLSKKKDKTASAKNYDTEVTKIYISDGVDNVEWKLELDTKIYVDSGL